MNHKRAIIYGIGIWVFVFAVSMLVFPLRDDHRPLFESIMPVALVLAVSWASLHYFRRTEKKTFMIGFCLGLIWLGVNLSIDLLAFSWGPMKMSLVDYIKDIGVTYAMMPIIPSAFGYLCEKINNNSQNKL